MKRLSAALAALCLAVPAAAQSPVDFPPNAIFNADIVVNDPDGTGPGPADAANDPVDSPTGSNAAFVTQSAATTLGCSSPAGLPDNGFFPQDANHPDVFLTYDNTDNGLNARRSPGAESYAFTVPSGNYSNVHFFFTAAEAGGNPDPAVTVTLIYATGPQTVADITVPDWFEEPSGPAYALIDNRDRSTGTSPPTGCEDANSTAIFGFNIAANPSQTLNSIMITRTDTGAAILSFLGATGVPASSFEDGFE
jgi:hypothetical protein